MASEHDDMKHELRRTRSVGAAVDTMMFTFRNRLRAALDADNGRGDMPALRALLADFDDRDGIRDAILHGTAAAKNDEDPEAPVRASNPGSLGGNVYGSQGPADNPRENSMGAPARGAEGLPENRVANGTTQSATTEPSLAEQLEAQRRDKQGGAPPADNAHVAPGATPFTEAPADHLETAPGAEKYKAGDEGQRTGQQIVNPAGKDKRTDQPSFGANDGERRREPALA